MKILVVDDEQLLVKGMKFNLENEGYMVETAYDGATAIDMAKSGGFDLIILDLMMPQVDGLTACMRIREFSNVPIIMLTARSEDADKIIGLESGADDYITKPFNILELKARIRALLRRANAAPQQKQPETLLLTAGGITLDQLTDSLESVQHPGIFFAGEALDVDGVCGGYNLQWSASLAPLPCCGCSTPRTTCCPVPSCTCGCIFWACRRWRCTTSAMRCSAPSATPKSP
mgnify:CR=1 FL=1